MLTPIEDRILNAQALAAGLAAIVMVKDLIRKGDEAQVGMFDYSLPDEARAQAVKETCEVNNTLMLIASIQALSGICA